MEEIRSGHLLGRSQAKTQLHSTKNPFTTRLILEMPENSSHLMREQRNSDAFIQMVEPEKTIGFLKYLRKENMPFCGMLPKESDQKCTSNKKESNCRNFSMVNTEFGVKTQGGYFNEGNAQNFLSHRYVLEEEDREEGGTVCAANTGKTVVQPASCANSTALPTEQAMLAETKSEEPVRQNVQIFVEYKSFSRDDTSKTRRRSRIRRLSKKKRLSKKTVKKGAEKRPKSSKGSHRSCATSVGIQTSIKSVNLKSGVKSKKDDDDGCSGRVKKSESSIFVLGSNCDKDSVKFICSNSSKDSTSSKETGSSKSSKHSKSNKRSKNRQSCKFTESSINLIGECSLNSICCPKSEMSMKGPQKKKSKPNSKLPRSVSEICVQRNRKNTSNNEKPLVDKKGSSINNKGLANDVKNTPSRLSSQKKIVKKTPSITREGKNMDNKKSSQNFPPSSRGSNCASNVSTSKLKNEGDRPISRKTSTCRCVPKISVLKSVQEVRPSGSNRAAGGPKTEKSKTKLSRSHSPTSMNTQDKAEKYNRISKKPSPYADISAQPKADCNISNCCCEAPSIMLDEQNDSKTFDFCIPPTTEEWKCDCPNNAVDYNPVNCDYDTAVDDDFDNCPADYEMELTPPSRAKKHKPASRPKKRTAPKKKEFKIPVPQREYKLRSPRQQCCYQPPPACPNYTTPLNMGHSTAQQAACCKTACQTNCNGNFQQPACCMPACCKYVMNPPLGGSYYDGYEGFPQAGDYNIGYLTAEFYNRPEMWDCSKCKDSKEILTKRLRIAEFSQDGEEHIRRTYVNEPKGNLEINPAEGSKIVAHSLASSLRSLYENVHRNRKKAQKVGKNAGRLVSDSLRTSLPAINRKYSNIKPEKKKSTYKIKSFTKPKSNGIKGNLTKLFEKFIHKKENTSEDMDKKGGHKHLFRRIVQAYSSQNTQPALLPESGGDCTNSSLLLKYESFENVVSNWVVQPSKEVLQKDDMNQEDMTTSTKSKEADACGPCFTQYLTEASSDANELKEKTSKIRLMLLTDDDVNTILERNEDSNTTITN